MGINTNLAQKPYWNDYSANSQYYHHLFKPSTPVQTRELNSTQSMLLNQINSFGDNIFVGGTIIKGCNITKDNTTSYVKLIDTHANGAALTASVLKGLTVVSPTSNLQAVVKDTKQGYISTAPNLNTIFIKYINTGNVASQPIKIFQQNETLQFFNSANVLIANVVVANDSLSGSSVTTGFSYTLGVDDGIIYQNGIFLNVVKQSIIVTPYNNVPDGISVGFTSPETIVTAYQDPNLNDNSMGGTNYQAPGADRLKIVPTLIVAPTSSVYSNNFFSVVDFSNGQPSYVNQDTQYSVIGDRMAQISDDTNGSFVIKNFAINTSKALLSDGVTEDTANIQISVSSGLGYINGKRVNLLGTINTTVPKGTALGQASNEITTTQMGNYVVVKDVAGYFNPSILQTVNLYNANTYAVSNVVSKGTSSVNSIVNSGTLIGTATIIGMEYLGGNFNTSNAMFNMYLTNIQMTGTNQFTSVCSIAVDGTTKAFADIVQSVTGTTYSTLQSPSTSPLIYSLGSGAVSSLKNALSTVDAQFQYVTSNAISFSAGSSTASVITIPSYTGGTDVLPYTGTISNAIEPQFRVVCESNATSANIIGYVTGTAACTAITGVGTTFNTGNILYTGALIYISNGSVTEIKQVNNIVSDTSLYLNQPLVNSCTSEI